MRIYASYRNPFASIAWRSLMFSLERFSKHDLRRLAVKGLKYMLVCRGWKPGGPKHHRSAHQVEFKDERWSLILDCTARTFWPARSKMHRPVHVIVACYTCTMCPLLIHLYLMQQNPPLRCRYRWSLSLLPEKLEALWAGKRDPNLHINHCRLQRDRKDLGPCRERQINGYMPKGNTSFVKKPVKSIFVQWDFHCIK